MISETNIQQPIRNLIGYGLRNPWNFIEHEGNLIIPDVGDKSNEELNIVNLDELSNAKKPFYLVGLFMRDQFSMKRFIMI